MDRAGAGRQARLAELRAHTGADVVAVTLDSEGAVVGGADGEPRRSHSTPVPASHAVGAGDAYLAAMTLALAADAPLPTAAQLAQLAATITVVGHRHLRLPPGGPARRARPRPTTRPARGAGRPRTPAEIVGRAPRRRALDRLHQRLLRRAAPGARALPGQARALGDLLVVAVNSDDSVRRLKGPDRPVNPVEDRVRPARRARPASTTWWSSRRTRRPR